MIDPALNARAIAIARAVRQRAIPGVRDVVSTSRSVAVFFDPLSTDVGLVASVLHEVASLAPPDESGRTVDVPVVYGGDAGPDLVAVASFCRCTPEAVVERHTERVYRVYMLGFLPGFAYMAHVDATIAAPRHEVPRLRVAAGSVGIAGLYTGVYPRESPGGWQIIGRTALVFFDPSETPPALLAPGDQVRFVPISASSVPASPSGESRFRRTAAALPPGITTNVSPRAVTVLRPGLFTTVQDSGRWGYQSLGVPAGGPMDHFAHRLGNLIVGNPADAATLEATLSGPELRMEQETRIVVSGGDLGASLDGVEVPLNAALRCRGGSVLRFGDRRAGTRAYVAFDGGIALTPVLGSRATHVVSGLGGVDGRALKAGDRLPLGQPAALRTMKPGHPAGAPRGGARLRVLPGPQADHFDRSALDALQRDRFIISPQSDRMGFRLSGRTSIESCIRGDMMSDVTFMGGVQIPPSGNPILLMADRQTTGGYPQLAIVITADLPLAGQLAPGDWVEFEVCGRSEAVAALVAAEGRILAVR